MPHRILTARRLAIVVCFAGLQAAGSSVSFAQSNSNDPMFGSRVDKADGSTALTIGRKLPTEWDTKFGMDATLAPEAGTAGIADTVVQGPAANRSSGTVWGSITGPAPVLWDKTSVDARFDQGQEQGQLITTMSRTVPLGESVTVTLQDKYSVTQSLLGGAAANQKAVSPTGAPVWEADRSVRFNVAPTGTTLSAGVVSSNSDNQWHNKLSAEQQLVGPLSVTTSVTDPATAASNKSIGARFKHTW